jgi:hypothetical protein
MLYIFVLLCPMKKLETLMREQSSSTDILVVLFWFDVYNNLS